MKMRTLYKLFFVVLILTLAACNKSQDFSSSQLESKNFQKVSSPQEKPTTTTSTTPSAESDPDFIGEEYQTGPTPNSLRLADIYVGLEVCVHLPSSLGGPQSATVLELKQEPVEKVNLVKLREYNQDSIQEVYRAAPNLGLEPEPVFEGQWSATWLSPGHCN